MRIAVTGSTGLIGSALVGELRAARHDVLRLVRHPPVAVDEVHWDPQDERLDAAKLAGVEVVVHLAGESIAGARWNPERKARIRDSRVHGTTFLATALAALAPPPRTLVCASAVGYYGDRGDEVLREDSPPGTGFLPEVCTAWEAAADPARTAGLRVVHLRTGIVLARHGGALAAMLPPFRLGLGGPVGSGAQFMSWIALEDHVTALRRAAEDESWTGAINSVAPNPVTNAAFSRALGRVLHRPVVARVPAFAARLLFGEMADALLLASARVEPARLAALGFRYRWPELEAALQHVLHER